MNTIIKEEQYKFEAYLEKSEKPLILFMVNESPGLKYGVGTYLKDIVGCIIHDNKNQYDFIVLILKAYIQSQLPQFDLSNKIPYYLFPYSNLEDSKYYKTISDYMTCRIPNSRKVIIHCNYACQVSFIEHFNVNHDVRIVYTQHYMDWCIRFGTDYEKVEQKIFCSNEAKTKFLQEKHIIKLADTILVSSLHSYNTLKIVYGANESKIKIIPLSVHHNIYSHDLSFLKRKYNITSEQRIILYVGRLDENKGIVSLIKAFSNIKINNVFLWVVGNGDFNSILNLIDKDNWHKITLWGFKDKQTIAEMCAIAEFGIVPSHYEEFGYVALEMMSEGLPIIVRNTTGLRDRVENGRWGVMFEDSNDIPIISKTIEDKLLNPTSVEYNNMMKKYMIEKYDIQYFSTELFNCYNSLLSY